LPLGERHTNYHAFREFALTLGVVAAGGLILSRAMKNKSAADYNLLQFFFRYFPQVTTLMEIPQGNTMEHSGK
jgi:hypothetical protein